jgi:hypothetical protein
MRPAINQAKSGSGPTSVARETGRNATIATRTSPARYQRSPRDMGKKDDGTRAIKSWNALGSMANAKCQMPNDRGNQTARARNRLGGIVHRCHTPQMTPVSGIWHLAFGIWHLPLHLRRVSWLATHWIVLLLLAAYGAMLVWHAREGRRGTRGVADYYVGGRRMGGIALGLSFFATYSSTNSFVGFAGQSYSYGAPWLLLAPMVVVFCVIAWTAIAPRLRRFTAELGSLTIPDFIGFRFDSRTARVLAAAIVIFSSFFYLTAVFKGIGTMLATFLAVDYTLAIWLFFLIVMAYTAVGGFISVVKTDAVQGIVMLGAAVLLFGGTITAAGGLGAVAQVREAASTAHLFSWDAAMPFAVLIGIIVAGTMKLMVEPRQLSRFYALRDAAAVRHGFWVATLSFLVVYALLVPIGLYAHLLLPEAVADSDRDRPAAADRPEHLSPGCERVHAGGARGGRDVVGRQRAAGDGGDVPPRPGGAGAAGADRAGGGPRDGRLRRELRVRDRAHRAGSAGRDRRDDVVFGLPLRGLLLPAPGLRPVLAPRRRPRGARGDGRRPRDAGDLDAARPRAGARAVPVDGGLDTRLPGLRGGIAGPGRSAAAVRNWSGQSPQPRCLRAHGLAGAKRSEDPKVAADRARCTRTAPQAR